MVIHRLASLLWRSLGLACQKALGYAQIHDQSPGLSCLIFRPRVVSRRQATMPWIAAGCLSHRSSPDAWQRLQRGTSRPSAECRRARHGSGPQCCEPVLERCSATRPRPRCMVLIDKPSKVIHVDRGCQSESQPGTGKIPGVVIHRSRRVVRQELPPWQLPRTPVAETVLDLVAASASFDDAYSWAVSGDRAAARLGGDDQGSDGGAQEDAVARMADRCARRCCRRGHVSAGASLCPRC